MLKTLLLGAALALTTLPANANTIDLGIHNNWKIQANLDYGYCLATTAYVTGEILSIGVNKQGFNIAFQSPQARIMQIGQRYTLDFVSSNGDAGRLAGVAIDEQQILVENLNERGVYALAKSRSISFPSLGRFDLSGSMQAIRRLVECYESTKAL